MSMVLAAACSGPQTSSSAEDPAEDVEPHAPSSPTETERCGDVVGTWSEPVDGLRGRLLTSGSQADRSSLRVEVELENVGTTPLAIHWDGYVSLGYATFRLDDEAGAEVPEPDWRLGGNAPGGSLREVIPVAETVRHVVGDVFARFNDGRILRIGAFWGREMPTDGSRRFLRAQLSGRAPRPDDLLVQPGEGEEGGTTVGAPPGPSAQTEARAWIGPLEIPAVCVD